MTSPIQTNLWGSVIKVSKPEGSGLGRVCAGPVCCAFACCVFLFLSVFICFILTILLFKKKNKYNFGLLKKKVSSGLF